MFSRLFTTACLAMLALSAFAQQPAPQAMGTVHIADATVTGGLEVSGQRALLLTNASVVAADRTAPIDLIRGGQVLVCSTSQFHLLRSGSEASLVFALDRGAIEIHGKAQPQDVIQTPDLRFALAASGTFDLRLRVTANGDTCVENAGAASPALMVSDAFSEVTYRLQSGQHVLFEHGDLHQVVDQERSACGCPPAAVSVPPPVIVAQSAGGSSTSADRVATQNPFPVAVSQGLAPETKPANNTTTPIGETHTQVAGVITYGDTAPTPAAAAPPAEQPQQTAKPVSTEPPPSPPGAHDIAHAIGRFFHRLFHPKG